MLAWRLQRMRRTFVYMLRLSLRYIEKTLFISVRDWNLAFEKPRGRGNADILPNPSSQNRSFGVCVSALRVLHLMEYCSILDNSKHVLSPLVLFQSLWQLDQLCILAGGFCIRSPSSRTQPETRIWWFLNLKPRFGKKAPALESLISTWQSLSKSDMWLLLGYVC